MTQEQLAQLLAAEQPAASKLDSLDHRELEVISLLGQGQGFRQVAQEMGITIEKLELLKKEIRRKLKLKSDLQLIQFAARQ